MTARSRRARHYARRAKARRRWPNRRNDNAPEGYPTEALHLDTVVSHRRQARADHHHRQPPAPAEDRPTLPQQRSKHQQQGSAHEV